MNLLGGLLLKIFSNFSAVIGNASKYNPCSNYLDEPQVPEELTKLDE